MLAMRSIQSYLFYTPTEETIMSELKPLQSKLLPLSGHDHGHAHPGGRRCCGRPISEKCSPEEEAAKTNADGEKSCCKGHHPH